MNWEQICNNPVLRNLPYKIETDSLGKLILSPAKNIHSFRQGQIMRLLLQRLSQGHVLPECAIETPAGVKVADVAWITAEHWSQACDEAAFTRAPALCIEVWSGSNTEQEIADKRALYFGAGAVEVWECDPKGQIHFFTREGQQTVSRLVPDFPQQIPLS